MKKLSVIFTAFILLVSTSFAQTTFDQVNELINSNLFKNKTEISNLSSDLTQNEKFQLYDMYLQDPKIFASINLYGFGSFKQKDYFAGSLILTGTVIGELGIYVGVIGYFLPILSIVGALAVDQSYFTTMGTIFWCGAGLFAGSAIASYIRPYAYSKKYNKILKQALNLDQIEDISVGPVANPYTKEIGFQVALKF